jgi:hypothetical protein
VSDQAVRDRLKKLVEANKGAVRSITFVGYVAAFVVAK